VLFAALQRYCKAGSNTVDTGVVSSEDYFAHGLEMKVAVGSRDAEKQESRLEGKRDEGRRQQRCCSTTKKGLAGK
jgi:hypothetical protein